MVMPTAFLHLLARRFLAGAIFLLLPWVATAAPDHGDGSAMLAGWQRAFEATRGKVVDEKVRHAWSPDGSQVVFERTVEGERGLWRCRLPDGELAAVLEGE